MMLDVLPQQRRQMILELVHREGGARVGELVRQFGVAEVTVRRDLELLAGRGLLSKVHGGATSLASSDEPGVRRRQEKDAIARTAAALIAPGTAVALSAGTTTWAAAHYLTGIPGLTVVTNSIAVAHVFHHTNSPDQKVVLTGGVRTPAGGLVGPVGIAAIESLNVDVLLLGIHGMTLEAGFTTPNLLEAEVNRALVAASRRIVVLADHTKWGTIGISTIARLGQAHTVIVDSGLDDDARRALSSRVPELVIVASS